MKKLCERCETRYTEGGEIYCQSCQDVIEDERKARLDKRTREINQPFDQCHRCGMRTLRGYWHCP